MPHVERAPDIALSGSCTCTDLMHMKMFDKHIGDMMRCRYCKKEYWCGPSYIDPSVVGGIRHGLAYIIYVRGEITPGRLRNRPLVWQKDGDSVYFPCPVCGSLCAIPIDEVKPDGTLSPIPSDAYDHVMVNPCVKCSQCHNSTWVNFKGFSP